jgi:hypothetical protein
MTHWTEIPGGVLNAAQLRFWGSLGSKAGEVALKMRDDPAYVTWLAGLACQNLFELSESQERAREIMGRNFFGVEEAIAHFRVNPLKQQLAYLAEVPFAEEVLMSCKDTHVLVAVFPLSLLDIRDVCKDHGLFLIQGFYNMQSFAKEKGEVSWQLIRKTPVDGSTSKTWDVQNNMLGKDEKVPTVREVVYMMIGHYKTANKRLFETGWVWCSDLDSKGDHVYVGCFAAWGLSVGIDGSDHRSYRLGLAAARKQ